MRFMSLNDSCGQQSEFSHKDMKPLRIAFFCVFVAKNRCSFFELARFVNVYKAIIQLFCSLISMRQIIIQKVPAFDKASLRKYSSIAVLVDENTRQFCYPLVKNRLPNHTVIEVPGGEEHKNLITSQSIWQQLTVLGLDRHALLIVLGGGVLGDMGGFCAATFKRGIDFLLMPTTLLAQVDASIGGKLAVDFGPHKNHIGVFQLPISTFVATQFLATLPVRELRSGFAEVIKHCLIGDKKMWKSIQRHPLEKQDWLKLVRHSVGFKSLVVKKDPREKGLRKILNFGHTLGHALEGYFLSSGSRIFHGEAIAAGMIMESHIANRKKLIDSKDLQTISDYIRSVFGKIEVPGIERLLPLVKQDKKNKGNTILMALPKGIGKAVWDVSVSEKDILEALDYYRSGQA